MLYYKVAAASVIMLIRFPGEVSAVPTMNSTSTSPTPSYPTIHSRDDGDNPVGVVESNGIDKNEKNVVKVSLIHQWI